MTVKSIQTLVFEANQEIKTINPEEAFKMVENKILDTKPEIQ